MRWMNDAEEVNSAQTRTKLAIGSYLLVGLVALTVIVLIALY